MEGSGQPRGTSEDWFVLIFQHWLSALISLEKLLNQIGEVGDGAGTKFSVQKSAGRDVPAVGAQEGGGLGRENPSSRLFLGSL